MLRSLKLREKAPATQGSLPLLTLRSRHLRYLTLLYVAVVMLWAVAVLLQSDGDQLAEAMRDIWVLTVVAFGCVCWFRASRARVDISAHGLRAQNLFSSFTCDWNEIDRIRPRFYRNFPRTVGRPAYLLLHSGRKRFMTAIQPPIYFNFRLRDKEADRVCAALLAARDAALENDGILTRAALDEAFAANR